MVTNTIIRTYNGYKHGKYPIISSYDSISSSSICLLIISDPEITKVHSFPIKLVYYIFSENILNINIEFSDRKANTFANSIIISSPQLQTNTQQTSFNFLPATKQPQLDIEIESTSNFVQQCKHHCC